MRSAERSGDFDDYDDLPVMLRFNAWPPTFWPSPDAGKEPMSSGSVRVPGTVRA